MITPADIENKEFSRGVRGYKEDEVDEFLDLIILDMEKLLKENHQLKKELEKAQSQVDRHVSTEGSVYDTLEAAKALMNDIAASAERRAQVILKDAELEAALITREAKEATSRLTEEANRMRRSVERIRESYRHILEMELERASMVGVDLFEDFEGEFLPASISDLEQLTQSTQAEPAGSLSGTARQNLGHTVKMRKPTEEEIKAAERKPDLTKTIINLK